MLIYSNPNSNELSIGAFLISLEIKIIETFSLIK